MTTYLNEFEKIAEKGVAYIPVGTIEWHGSHLPIETDFLIAVKICEEIVREFPGYILPPIYLGGYSKDIIGDIEMRGMDRKVGKKLYGNLYFLEPDLFEKVLKSLIQNLKDQGFKKIIVLTGHGGDGQLNVLEKVKENDILVINLYEKVEIHHADEGETSLLWACYPEEESKSRAIKTPKNDDLTKYRGYDIMAKSSLELGTKNLEIMINDSKKKVEEFLKK